MAIPHKDLSVGSVVRLVCGSPKLAVERIEAPNRICLLGWSDAAGFVTRTVHPDLLTWPRKAEASPPADSEPRPDDADESGDDA